ncbi:MAG: VWA domain-containing protein, partial [Myxococcota bacterium]
LNPVPSPEPPPAPVLQVNTSVLPAPSIRLGDVVTVHGRLSNGYVAASSPGEISALFDLQATERPNGPRPHTAVALVVDRSGSMAGEKIRQARRAAKMLISRLDDEDQVAIVTYSSDFAVDLPLTTVRGRRNQVNRVIDEILDGGGTNLSGGLQAGLRALGRAAPMMARRLILLSDGNANQGITDPTTIGDIAADARRLGVTVSTLGVGVDFNEDLMNLIAQSAGGGYYYARDAATIASAFERELQGLKTLAARQVELSFELAPGMRIKEVFGYRTEIRGGRTVIPVGDMAGGETRRVMIRLSVDPIMAGQGTSLGVLLSHESADGRQPHEFRAELTSMATRDAAKVALGASRDVEEAFAAAHAAAARKDAAASFSSGNRQKAVRSLQNIIAHTKRTNKNLNSAALKNQVDEMQKTLGELRSYRYDSEAGKDLIKREKLRARQVFIH